ncbi:hypothetical protein [Streptomyces sp. NPDC058373]|uniref:hypothetical protein n=1 Tax=Streptomyces sp. NPDC058373 TaxID=3346465 RepID=UPI00364E1E45
MPARRTALPALLLTALALLAVPADPALAAPPARPDPGPSTVGNAAGAGRERPGRTDPGAPWGRSPGFGESETAGRTGMLGHPRDAHRHDPGTESALPQDHHPLGMLDPPRPPARPAPPDRTPSPEATPDLPGAAVDPTGQLPGVEAVPREPEAAASPSAPPSPSPHPREHRREPAQSLPAPHGETAYRAAPHTSPVVPRDQGADAGPTEEDAASDVAEAPGTGQSTEQRAMARTSGRSLHTLPLGGGLIMVGLGLGLVFVALRVRRI